MYVSKRPLEEFSYMYVDTSDDKKKEASRKTKKVGTIDHEI
jgi:hypothetical protein